MTEGITALDGDEKYNLEGMKSERFKSLRLSAESEGN